MEIFGLAIVVVIAFAGGATLVYFLVERVRKESIAREANNQLQHQELQSYRRSLADYSSQVQARESKVVARETSLSASLAEFQKRVIGYDDLLKENQILRLDVRRLDVEIRKQRAEERETSSRQAKLDDRTEVLARRYLKDNISWITKSLTADNFAASKQKLKQVVSWCRDIGFAFDAKEEEALVAELKREYEQVVRAALEREEQARIKAQIREEEAARRERDRAMAELERRRSAIDAALQAALTQAHDAYSAEIESLKTQLAEVESSQRAISQAQLTKAGYVYVISNIGSFGENVFKIGMTRRLEPLDRVRELGDASVPFPFDVHMMISCKDAPSLENALHRKFFRCQVNKTNPRKEFFRANIGDIAAVVREHHGEVEYKIDAEAFQYRQSLEMKDEDLEFIEDTFHDAEDVIEDAGLTTVKEGLS
jgi:hypothetical protein